ncbi:MAG: hypothetical protein ACTS3F_08125 [Phycisphaerales bacterium]
MFRIGVAGVLGMAAGVSGCAGSGGAIIAPDALRSAGDRVSSRGAMDGSGVDGGEGSAWIEDGVWRAPDPREYFEAMGFGGAPGMRIANLSAAGDCIGGREVSGMRFIQVRDRRFEGGVVHRTSRVVSGPGDGGGVEQRTGLDGGGGSGDWEAVQSIIGSDPGAIRTHTEEFVPPAGRGEDAGGVWLLETVNHERGTRLRFVSRDGGTRDGLRVDPAPDESRAVWRTAGVVQSGAGEEERSDGGVSGIARVRCWVGGESAGTDVPRGVVVITELRIELGAARLERDVVRVFAEFDGEPAMVFERSSERTRVMGFGGSSRCEMALLRVDIAE